MTWLIVDPYIRDLLLTGQYTWRYVGADLVMCVLLISISLLLSHCLSDWLDKDRSLWRRYATTLLLLLGNVLASAALSPLASWLWGEEQEAFSVNVLVFCICSTFVTSIHTHSRFWRQSMSEIERQQRQEIRMAEEVQNRREAELMVLKSKLNPHFLFNSLSVLNQLIGENPQQAQFYLSHLSRLYRYVVVNMDKVQVPLSMELEVVEHYIQVTQMRMGQTVRFDCEYGEADAQGMIFPMTLQSLIENAVKHNIHSQSRPLHIRLSIRDGMITISNNIQPLRDPEPSTGIGQKVILQAYKIHGDGLLPTFGPVGDSYIVRLPILPITTKSKDTCRY